VNLTFIPVSAYSGQANVNIISVHAAFAVLSSCIIKLIAINSNKSLSNQLEHYLSDKQACKEAFRVCGYSLQWFQFWSWVTKRQPRYITTVVHGFIYRQLQAPHCPVKGDFEGLDLAKLII